MIAKERSRVEIPRTTFQQDVERRLKQFINLTNRFKLISISSLAVLLAMIGFAFYLYRPIQISVAKPERNVVVKVFGLGTVEARIFSRIGFKISGTLVTLYADHGDKVHAGQVVARIDSSEQRARVAKAEAQLLSAEAAVQVARAAAGKAEAQLAQRVLWNRRRQELLSKQSISIEAAEEAQLTENTARSDVLVTRAEQSAAEARLKDAKAQIEIEKTILSQHDLTAPFDGVIVLRAKELGSILAATEPLFTIAAPDTIWILAYVDEVRSGDIRLGQSVEIRLRSIPNAAFQGKVERIGIESDRVNEERRIYVSCQGCPETFYLGEQSEVYITTAVLDVALLIPEVAVEFIDSSHGNVWTIEKGRLGRRQITLGKRSLDGRVEVSAPLPEGTSIVTVVLPGFAEGRSARIVHDR